MSCYTSLYTYTMYTRLFLDTCIYVYTVHTYIHGVSMYISIFITNISIYFIQMEF